MPQLFVPHSVLSNSVGVAVHVPNRNGIRWTGKRRQEGIPNTNASGVMRSYVTNLNSPSPGNLALQSNVVLLSVGGVGIERCTGKGCQIDRAVRRGAAIIQAPLAGRIHENRGNVRVVRVRSSEARIDITEPGEERCRRYIRRRDDRRRRYVRNRIRLW